MIALDRLTVAVLRRYHTTTALEGHAGGFVFTNQRGDPIKPDQFGELFQRLVRAAGLPRTGCMTCVTARPVWPPVMVAKIAGQRPY